ncbi:probable G-protein coupled receptor 156 isoform X2 [Syngnathoides biaculeatus]|uniref:probable G-protein coupled receptor 156 isoform X2 n=1 Tax=Syngnathoides biaculeatus TaxID=300417 RepID=UPI002ADDFF4B|nr:probable G-protein coupled receptor 156 isoform X2 [Syngnathoides biaculeatus]
MEPEWNCSSRCDSPACLGRSGVRRQQESAEVLQRLCNLSRVATDFPRRSLSPVLSAVVWTLLSCGILVAFCFLLFTLRFKHNRIVKMSSPNLNMLSLLGSVLAYISGFLFAVDTPAQPQFGASTAVLHARVWTLCLGSTMVFGPILGKTWRLYRVFTQRVPDKRVIIRDIQLMAMVALLILVDLLVLTAWNLSDPIRCSRSLGAVVKMAEKEISCSLSQLDSCSSAYSNLWVIIIVLKKACLLLFGTYLAGLTSDVSHPPVNQTPTILTAVTLVTLCSGVVVPVAVFMASWPNVVYGAVAGAIFICTLATNCMLFVPQLTEWRHFEEDHINPSQMAKYFSSPSKSQPSVYSQDDVYFLLGENSSMKKLLSEKNAVIDSLQEQVSNAKDKLLRLVSASQPIEEQDVDNRPSSSTQTAELQSCHLPGSLPHSGFKSTLSPPPPVSPRLDTVASSPGGLGSSDCPPLPCSVTPAAAPFPLSGGLDTGPCKSITEDPLLFSGFLRTTEETVQFVNSLQSPRLLNPFEVEMFSNGSTSPLGPNTRPAGFVSSEKLQEILQELSVDTVLETVLKSARRPSSHGKLTENSSLSPISLRTLRSPKPPLVFRYPSISPYAMRKRRPPFRSPRRGYTPPCLHAERRMRDDCQNLRKHPEGVNLNGGVTMDGSNCRVPSCDLDVQDEDVRSPASRPHRCSTQHISLSDVETGGDTKEHPSGHAADPRTYWDSDSSSSADYCFYHRPYCDSCLQRGSLLSSDSSNSSDSDGSRLSHERKT